MVPHSECHRTAPQQWNFAGLTQIIASFMSTLLTYEGRSMFGVDSLLVVEKVLLMSNDVAMLLFDDLSSDRISRFYRT